MFLTQLLNIIIIFFTEQDNGKPVEFLGKIPLRQRAVIVNAVLVALATLEIFLALASVAICARETCHCSKMNSTLIGSRANLLEIDTSPEGRAKADRLATWIRQQTFYQNHPNVKVSCISCIFKVLIKNCANTGFSILVICNRASWMMLGGGGAL